MISKDSRDKLLKQGVIKKCPVDLRAAKKLLDRAAVDLNTARRNLKEDEECAYAYAYNSMLRAGLALMFSEGFRPDIRGKHQNIVRFSGVVLGKPLQNIINDYDRIRRTRNQFIYEPDIPCSRKEAEDAIGTAETFVRGVLKLIGKRHPREGFSDNL